MKITISTILFSIACSAVAQGQNSLPNDRQRREISAVIDQYSLARENRDTVLLKTILTSDVDQLVSTGEWRTGLRSAVDGMLASSASRPGTRTLSVDKIKLLGDGCAVVDCKYEILNSDGSARRMWSTFIVVSARGKWRISAIRNMLPAGG